MVQSAATTVAQYLAGLDPDRRATIAKVRQTILKNLPAGYVETMNWGMISYEIPLSTYATTYNKQPLSYAGLASQKNYCAVYLMSVYSNPAVLKELKDAYAKSGKKLDMGKCCIRFKTADDLPLAVIGKIVGGTSVKKYIGNYEKVKPPKKK